jgi:hypothetical protein
MGRMWCPRDHVCGHEGYLWSKTSHDPDTGEITGESHGIARGDAVTDGYLLQHYQGEPTLLFLTPIKFLS